jgi:hypothetical protein
MLPTALLQLGNTAFCRSIECFCMASAGSFRRKRWDLSLCLFLPSIYTNDSFERWCTSQTDVAPPSASSDLQGASNAHLQLDSSTTSSGEVQPLLFGWCVLMLLCPAISCSTSFLQLVLPSVPAQSLLKSFYQYLPTYKMLPSGLVARHLLCAFAMLVMASTLITTHATSVVDSTATLQTTSALTDTSIVSASGTPPPVTTSTLHFASASLLPTPTARATTSSSTSPQLSVPAIAGIAAGGAFLLITAIIFITFTCLKRRGQAAQQWPKLPPGTEYRTALRRPSSAATLVAAPYTHSKGNVENIDSPLPLHYTKSTKSCKSTCSTILERVSEETAREFKFNFGIPPPLEHADSNETLVQPPPETHEDTLQKLSLDKSLPSSPEHEIPMVVLDLDRYQAEDPGRPRSSIYSTVTPMQGRESQGYF